MSSLDNCVGTSDLDKSPDVNTSSLERRGCSPGDSMFSSDCVPMLPDEPSSTPAFIPRHFPPPALADVPVDYIVHKLHQLAPKANDESLRQRPILNNLFIPCLTRVRSRPYSSPCRTGKASPRYAALHTRAGASRTAEQARSRWLRPKDDRPNTVCCSSCNV